MSEHHRDPDADWALASAYVDGEVDADERAVVEGDPHLLDLVVRLGGVRTALAAPVPIAEATRTAAIAAALDRAESDDQPLSASRTRDHAQVIPLSARSRHARRWLGGAAAAAVIAVLVGVAVTSRSSDDTSTAVSKASATTTGAGFGQSAATADDAARSAEAPAPAAPEAAGEATTVAAAATTSAASRQDTGGALTISIDEPEQLLDLPVAEQTTAAISTTTVTAGTTPGVGPTSCLDAGETLLAVITYRGTAAIATLDAPAHVRRAKAVSDCTILAEVPDQS